MAKQIRKENTDVVREDEVIDEMPATVDTIDLVEVDDLIDEIEEVLEAHVELADDLLLGAVRDEKLQKVKAHGASRSQDGVVTTRAWSFGGRVD